MTPKRLEFSPHAIGRIRLRGIDRHTVRWLLAKGQRVKAPPLAGEQRWACSGRVRKRPVTVIFLEDAHRFLVVTVQYDDA